MVQQVRKRKRRKQGTVLLTDYECLSNEEMLDNIEHIETKLFSIFKYHIGNENPITPYELFVHIFRMSPYEMDVFKRNYWWNVLKTVMRKMRTQGTLFIINKGAKLYVLKTYEEANEFKDKTDRNIKALNNLKSVADQWVREEKWRRL